MNVRLGVIMDPIATIKPYKDTTLALLLAAQQHGWALNYMEMGDLFLRDGKLHLCTQRLQVRDDNAAWFELGAREILPAEECAVILMRKDPPFDTEYLYATLLLDHAVAAGTLVVNHPQALRDANEKLYAAWFPECCPPTLVTRDRSQIKQFITEQGDAILKPLDAMGGRGIFRLRPDDANLNAILEAQTVDGTRTVMVQRYLPEIVAGDKRILLIDGEPVPYALARLPAPGETRANLAAGGRGVGVELSARDRWICAQVGPRLRQRGLFFVGLDVIGDYLTEINVTSPTGVRELDAWYNLNIGGQVIEALQRRLEASLVITATSFA